MHDEWVCRAECPTLHITSHFGGVFPGNRFSLVTYHMSKSRCKQFRKKNSVQDGAENSPMIRPIELPGTVMLSDTMGGWSTITFLTNSSAWCTASCVPRITSIRSSSFWLSPLKLIRVLVDSWIWKITYHDRVLLN